MTGYLITACGAVFLSVIVSFIMPQGKLSGTIAFVMRMICVVILVLPLAKLFFPDSEKQQELVDYDYICSVYSRTQSRALEEELEEEFGAETVCEVSVAYGEEGFYAESVKVGITGNYDTLSHEIYAYLQEADYINITVYESSRMVQTT